MLLILLCYWNWARLCLVVAWNGSVAIVYSCPAQRDFSYITSPRLLLAIVCWVTNRSWSNTEAEGDHQYRRTLLDTVLYQDSSTLSSHFINRTAFTLVLWMSLRIYGGARASICIVIVIVLSWTWVKRSVYWDIAIDNIVKREFSPPHGSRTPFFWSSNTHTGHYPDWAKHAPCDVMF